MAHLETAYQCSACRRIPDSPPVHHCRNRHAYCHSCFQKLQSSYTGGIIGAANCLMCKYSGKFETTNVDFELLKKIKTKPGIGRPYRYQTSVVHIGY